MSKTFRDLRVYQIGAELLPALERFIAPLPKREFREMDQIRRASRSIVTNLAEGYAKRRYQRELLKYLTNALGSCDEVQVHLDILSAVPGADTSLCDELQKRYKNLSVRLYNFIHAIRKNHSL